MNTISDTNRELANFKIRKQQIKDRLNELRKPTLIAELNSFEEKKKQLTEELFKMILKKKILICRSMIF